MGYQGGRRYGGDDRDTYGRDSYGRERSHQDRYSSDWDRGNDRYRASPDSYRSDSYRYGTRGQFAGPADNRRPPSDYDPQDRGFFDRAGDEIRSWFGDEEAERRREYDDYYYNRDSYGRDDERGYAPYSGYSGSSGRDTRYGTQHDNNYHSWRRDRIAELDRDYADYQRENRDRFHQEFTGWRSRRGEQRQALGQVREHMEVVGSDGEHVGKVDKLRGDRIILTKSDGDAGGVHHSVPCGWIKAVDAQKVTLEKTAEQAQTAWREEREQQAMFGGGYSQTGSYDRNDDATTPQGSATSGTRYR